MGRIEDFAKPFVPFCMATPLIKKLGIKAGNKLLLQNPLDNYYELLGEIPEDVVEIDPALSDEKVDFIHFFVSEKARLDAHLLSLKARLKPHAMLWISWPKQASKLPTNLNRDLIREIGLEAGLVDVKVCSVNQQWSGLKFVYRKEDRGE